MTRGSSPPSPFNDGTEASWHAQNVVSRNGPGTAATMSNGGKRRGGNLVRIVCGQPAPTALPRTPGNKGGPRDKKNVLRSSTVGK